MTFLRGTGGRLSSLDGHVKKASLIVSLEELFAWIFRFHPLPRCQHAFIGIC